MGRVTTLQWHLPPLAHATGYACITSRQADVLAGICQGHTYEQIGTRLGVSNDSVRKSAWHMFQALGAKDRAHAAALAASGQLTIVVRGVR